MNLSVHFRALTAALLGGWCGVALGLGPATAEETSSAEADGQALAAELRTQRPADDLRTGGVLRLRDAQGKWFRRLPVQMEAVGSNATWQSLYRVFDTNQNLLETLTVTHIYGQPTRYEHARLVTTNSEPVQTQRLSGDQATVAFAGTDFWLADLGLEFFHWPRQRLTKREMRKGRSCKVLESANPNPRPGVYARVLSWIDLETGGLLRAEAYGVDGKLLKEFSIGSFKKVNGQWELKSMEIRNESTDGRTRLEFDLSLKPVQ